MTHASLTHLVREDEGQHVVVPPHGLEEPGVHEDVAARRDEGVHLAGGSLRTSSRTEIGACLTFRVHGLLRPNTRIDIGA